MVAVRFPKVVDGDILSKFGMQIELHLLKQMPALNLNPEVHFRLYGFRNGYDVITPPIWSYYYVTPSRPLDLILHSALVPLVFNLHATFEVSRANRIQIWRESQNHKSKSRDHFTTLFDLILLFFVRASRVQWAC